MYGVSDGSVRDRHLKDDSEHQETARYHPFRPQSLQRQLGNLRWRDFHPLEHQLASLHYPGALQLGSKQETGEIAGNKGKQRVAQDFITLDMTADGTKRISFLFLTRILFGEQNSRHLSEEHFQVVHTPLRSGPKRTIEK